MNEIIINDNLAKNNKMLEHLTRMIDAAYMQIQEAESEKTPNRLRPYTVNISAPTTPAPLCVNVMPRNPSRDSMSLYNVGTGSVIWSNTWFDPTSILQQFSDPAHPGSNTPLANQIIEIGYVPSGASVTINSTEPLYCYNVGGNALVTIVESMYVKPGSLSATIPVPGIDGAIGAGYTSAADVDGNPILIKGIR